MFYDDNGCDLMKYYKLRVKLELNNDMHFSDVSSKIGVSLQKAMYNQEKLKRIHDERRYKYIYSPLIPFVMKEKYLKREKYNIDITSFDEDLIVKFNYALTNFKNNFITVLGTKLSEHNFDNLVITEIETITPIIITIDNEPWMLESDSINLLIQKVYDNVEKKYLEFFDNDIVPKSDFNKYNLFQKITILNKKPIARKYKNIKLIGNKIRINISANLIAQKLARTAIVMGLGEKNSALGSGFVKYKAVRR